MSLLQLPNELILGIAEYLELSQLKYLYSFLRANRRFAHLLLPLLHRFATNEKYIMSALCWSAAIKNEGMTKYLLDHGGDTIFASKIAGDGNSNSPRVEKNDRTLVEHVLAEGPNLTVASLTTEGHPCAVPALHQALLMNYGSLAKLLIENGADVATWSQGYSTLHHAAFTQDETIVNKLLEKGADVTVVDPKGVTPLHLAAVHSNEAVLKVLLRNGADTMSTDVHGRTPISLLACCSTLIPRTPRESPWDVEEGGDSLKRPEEFSKVRIMLEQGNIAYKDRVGNTGLHRAAILGDVALAKILLQRGANIKARGPKERTALHFAAMSGSSVIIKDMVENYGADVMARDRYGNTPLHLAIQYKRRGTARLLIWMGVDVNIKDKCSRTAMHWAAGMGDVDAVKLLLSKGASITVRDRDERTPLFLAAELGHVSVVKILADNGADIDTQDKYGDTVPALVVSEVLDHPERCFAGSQSIPMGKWPRREQWWGIWYNISEKTSERGLHRVLCNPGQHIFRHYTIPGDMCGGEGDQIIWDAGSLFGGN